MLFLNSIVVGPNVRMVLQAVPVLPPTVSATVDVPNICHGNFREATASDDARQSVQVASAIR